MVDAWKVWSRITVTTLGNPIEEQKKFYAILAAELIDNVFDGVSTQGVNPGGGDPPPEDRTITLLRNPRTGEIRRALDLHLTPTKRKHKTNDVLTSHTFQGRCNVVGCNGKLMLICSGCDENENVEKDVFICDPRKKSACWESHVEEFHRY
jgi:hypothetical protein